ncbi:MAG: RsmE family RNA methyltransferase [Candidatus Gracilibacteria bacterium]
MTKTLHRFFVEPQALVGEPIVLNEKETVHQLFRVLRQQAGDKVILLDNTGMEYEAKILTIAPHQVVLQHGTKQKCKGEPEVCIRLLQGIPKNPAKFEEVLRHGTEVGITEFYPLLTEHTEVPFLRKRERMAVILKEATEQCERGKIPILGPETNFSEILKNGLPPELQADVTLLAYAREKEVLISSLLPSLKKAKTINLIIGPEGGFSDQEVELARERGFTLFGLGPRILRTETAGPVIAGIVLYCGD